MSGRSDGWGLSQKPYPSEPGWCSWRAQHVQAEGAGARIVRPELGSPRLQLAAPLGASDGERQPSWALWTDGDGPAGRARGWREEAIAV
jgi:hypothetical protein